MKKVRNLWSVCGLFAATVLLSSCGGDGNVVDPDTTPPTVFLVSPADEATNVPIGSAISVTFSEAIDPATINSNSFIIEPAVTGTFEKSGAVITFTPSSDLTFFTLYIVTLTTDIKDVAGNSLAEDKLWGFTTLSNPNTGVVWFAHSTGISSALNDIVWGNSKFVVVGDSGKILNSALGVTWNTSSNADTNHLNAVAWSGTVFTAVGDFGTILVSLDGVTWTKKNAINSHNLNDIVAYQSGFAAVGDSGTVLKAASDGTGWIESNAQISDSINLEGITVATPQLFVVVGIHDSAGILSSRVLDGGVPDGLSVRRKDSLLLFYGVSWSDASVNRYVAVGGSRSQDSAASILSLSGTTWSNAQSGFATGSLLSVTWTGEMFVAVGRNGNIMTSPTGTNWVMRSSGTSNDIHAVIWTGSRLAAVDGFGNVYTSP